MEDNHISNVSNTHLISCRIVRSSTLLYQKWDPLLDCIISTNKQPRIITASNLPLRGAIYCNGIYSPTRKSLARRPLSMPSKEVLPFVHDEADSALFLCSVSHTMSLFPLWGSKSSILLCIYICSKTQIILHYTLLFEGADSLPRVAHLTFASWGNDFLP